MQELKSKNMLNEEQMKVLKLNFDEDSLTLIENELKTCGTRVNGMRYSEEVKCFAVIMHFYSSQA